MPVIEVWRAARCIVIKRSLAAGYAQQENPLFVKENTAMLLGDAKAVAEGLREGVKRLVPSVPLPPGSTPSPMPPRQQ